MLRGVRVLLIVSVVLSGPIAGAAGSGTAGSGRGDRGTVRPWLGILLGNAADGSAEIVGVVPGSPAENAGIRPGDQLVAVAGQPVSDRESLLKRFDALHPGQEVGLELLRAGHALPIRVRVAARPEGIVQIPLAPVSPTGDDAVRGAVLAEIPPELRQHFKAPAGSGALVTRVEPGSAAARDGLRVGDVLVRAGGREIRSRGDLEAALAGRGRAVQLDVVREGRPTTVVLGPSAVEPSERSARIEALRGEIDRLSRRLDELRRQLEEEQGSP